jgi:hypothetical protein
VFIHIKLFYKYLFLFLILLSGNVQARDLSFINFQYKDKSSKTNLSAPANFTQRYIREQFRIEGFNKFYTGRYQPLQYVDQIFENKNQLVMIKSGLEAPQELLEKEISFRSGHLRHIKSGQIQLSIYFEKVSLKMRNRISDSLKKSVAGKKVSFIDYLIPTFYADETNGCEIDSTTLGESNLHDVENVSNELSASYLLSLSSSCIQDVISGAWAATGGVLTSAAQGLFSFIKNPIKSGQKFWNGAVNIYKSTKNFIANFKTEIKGMMTTIASLSTETQVSLICQLVGSLGSATIIGLLTSGPLGLSRTLIKLSQQVKKVKRLAGVFKAFEKLRGKLPDGVEVKDLIGRALKSTKENVLRKLIQLSDTGFPRLTQRYALCAL